MTARVCIDQNAIELTEGGSVVGPVWFDLNGVTFPEEGWFDFPAPILTWWIAALTDLTSRATVETSLQFMDGPFELRLNWVGEAARARCLRSGRPFHSAVEIDPQELLDSAIEQAVRLLAALPPELPASSDLDDLKRALGRIR